MSSRSLRPGVVRPVRTRTLRRCSAILATAAAGLVMTAMPAAAQVDSPTVADFCTLNRALGPSQEWTASGVTYARWHRNDVMPPWTSAVVEHTNGDDGGDIVLVDTDGGGLIDAVGSCADPSAGWESALAAGRGGQPLPTPPSQPASSTVADGETQASSSGAQSTSSTEGNSPLTTELDNLDAQARRGGPAGAQAAAAESSLIQLEEGLGTGPLIQTEPACDFEPPCAP